MSEQSGYHRSVCKYIFEYISDNNILFCYPECHCACVKRILQKLSKTWCYCTLGNTDGIFSTVFQRDVKVTLLEGIKTGSDKCVIEVEWSFSVE